MIAGVGLPYAYDNFDKKDRGRPSGPPYICFLYPGDDGFHADDINYTKITELVIELYTDNVRFDLEARLEAALTAKDLAFSSDRRYISGERMYQTTYTTEVLLNHADDDQSE